MPIARRTLLATGAAAAVLPRGPARAEAARIRIGVLNDQSGPYRDDTGMTSVACCRQAIADFGATGKGIEVDVMFADHQNKPDVGAGIARQWIDRDGVDFIVDVPNSGVALAVQSVVRDRNKVYVNTSAGTTKLTGEQCSPNMLHWTFDTYMLAHSTGGALVRSGGDSWYFLTADYAFGQQLQKDASVFVEQAGGKVLGASAYPFPETTDFSSLLVKAQATGAKVLGLANAGSDTQNCIKQAQEFGLTAQMKIAALLIFLNDVHAVGPAIAQGLVLTESFYWDLNDRTRAFTRRVLPATPDNYPNMNHAGTYAATLHYLKAVHDMGVAEAKKDGIATVDRMKAMPFEDDCFGSGRIREDGRVLVPAHLFQVKTPAESKSPWDLYKLLATTPGEQAFRPLADGHCAFVKS